MIRKSILAVLCILPILSWGCCWYSPGFYLGAGIGADTTNYDETAYIAKPGEFNAIDKTEKAAQGVLGNIFGGYGWHYSWFYLAGELNGNISSAEFTVSNQEFIHNTYSKTTFKINRSWGASILPGVLLPGAALIYVRVGYTDGSFHINTSDKSLANANKSLGGLKLGLGLEKQIYKKLSARAEYDHINYQNFTEVVYEPIGNVTKKTILSPDSNQFEVDLVYRFG